MHQPGIEPGSVPWQGTILPLDHWCYAVLCEIIVFSILNVYLFGSWPELFGAENSEIHSTEEIERLLTCHT
jgi:hypothetical protein